MKHFLLLLFVLVAMLPCTTLAQDRNNDDEVVKIDRFAQHASVPNQLLVKFHDYSDIRVDATKGGKRFTSPTKAVLQINKVLDDYAVANIEQLIPNFVMPKSPRSSKSYGGQDVVEHDLSQIHLITLSDSSKKNNFELIEALNALDEVEFAEPNYICYALGTPAEEMAVNDATAVDRKHINKTIAPKTGEDTTFTTNDPMYSMQWGFTATRLDSLLMQPKLDSTRAKKIIAIIDTGVDIDHPDLAANIWINTAEQNGATNQDDDNNGFRDDVHGWDFVNQTGNMRDNNSHGTHCAGIAAAVGHNGIGVIGANPDALIMPVTVMQSDGTGNTATIIQGINYAAQNGADILSMSIGTYSYSIAMEQALAQAYQNCLLVAAAGNDATPIDQRCGVGGAPMYPGAFTFVIGVQATQEHPNPLSSLYLTGFSNFDCDGPSYSQYNEEQLFNYEISAPGKNIMSTVPNGQYRSCSGTSMACPLVAGGLSALMDRRDYVNKEVLFGDMINNNQEFYHINFMNMYNTDSVAPAILQLVSYEVNDTLYGDSSMYADAGERIQIYPTIRTVWGPADSITTWVEFQEFEDTSVLHFVHQYVDFGHRLSSYAKDKSANPIDILIDSNVVDGRIISLTLFAASPSSLDTLRFDFSLKVTNGVTIHGILTHNDTLWPNVNYIVTRNFIIPSDASLVIKPGVTINFRPGTNLINNGKLLAVGKPDSIIYFKPANQDGTWGGLTLATYDTLKYCDISGILVSGTTSGIIRGTTGHSVYTYYNDCNNKTIYTIPYLENCIIHDNNSGGSCGLYQNYVSFNKCNIFNNIGYTFNQSSYNCAIFHKNSRITTVTYPSGYEAHGISKTFYGDSTSVEGNNLVNNRWSVPIVVGRYLSHYRTYNNVMNNWMKDRLTVDIYNIINISAGENQTTTWHDSIAGELYMGSGKESIVRQHIIDIENYDYTSNALIELTNLTQRPVSSAHGIVWKVEVNGYDAQDEFDSITPLGTGIHEFKVYFSHAMDTSVMPMLAMGVRPPYTQTAISDSSYWNSDSTIWTAHLTLNGREAIDGLNRIYVANAEDDEHFEIPIENLRFNVQVSSAGSMSAGFQATPGIGKVDLEWNDQEVNYEDFLGFNLYRYQYDSVLTNRHYVSGTGYVYDTVWMPVDTTLLNTTLLQDTMYTDYEVTPGERYYYYYKILSTSLTENSPSKTVSCVPQSSIRGDANGSYAVDIADVITAINYMTNQNPQPFLFDATDVNGDGTIDVLDVVGIINIILYGDQSKEAYEQQTAIYIVEDGILYVDSPVALGGLQFTLDDCTMNDIEVLDALTGFELINAPVADGDMMLMAYSMSGRQVPAGKTALLRIGEKEIGNIVLSDPQGHNVIALKGGELGITDIEAVPAQIMKVFPNPFEKDVAITFNIGMQDAQKALLTFTDLMGREVAAKEMSLGNAGQYTYTWKADGMPKGVYFVTLSVDNAKAHTTKLILK